jgi:MFS family permease
MNSANDRRLFIACFVALVATAFGFTVRGFVLDEWAAVFHLSETDKGTINGAALWPFAISIVLFSLVIDHIGYGRAAIFACICHITYVVIVCSAPYLLHEGGSTGEIESGRKSAFYMLYLGNFIVALGNGTVEAFINPIVATMFSKEKTKWLNILHAGWPGGIVLSGVLAIGLAQVPEYNYWQYKVGILLIPVFLYAVLLMGCKFPVSERVAAGVPYRDMLKEAGMLGAMLVTALIVFEVSNVFTGMGLIFQSNFWRQEAVSVLGLPIDYAGVVKIVIILAISLAYGAYVRSLGRPLFVFLMIVMIPLATTELGTDGWITTLMRSPMEAMGVNAGWILVYTAFIMTVLRFFAGPIVHRLSPLGLLALSSAIAALGLVSLSLATGVMILVAATLYGFGKTFFWPTMLGVVSEQFPKGGALTLNMISGVGMMGVGIVGMTLLGNLQDRDIGRTLNQENPQLYNEVMKPPTPSLFGEYRPLDQDRVRTLPQEDQSVIEAIQMQARKNVLKFVAILPCFMLVCYLLMLLYFKARGGYKAQVLAGHAAEDLKYTGGLPAAVEE